jgi:hypothetical protein
MRRALLASGLFVLITLCFAQVQRQPLDVSLLQLIATPERYDGRVVRVEGYLRLEFEESVLYLHKEDSEQMLSRNAVWISFGPQSSKANGLRNQYVIVEGKFRSDKHGHMGAFVGAIEEVTRVDKHLSRAEIERLARDKFPKANESTHL